MSDSDPQFVQQAQEANRSMGEAMRGLAGTQFKIMQQLVGVQREQFQQALEAARNQPYRPEKRAPRGCIYSG